MKQLADAGDAIGEVATLDTRASQRLPASKCAALRAPIDTNTLQSHGLAVMRAFPPF
jgi:hypothetical protein